MNRSDTLLLSFLLIATISVVALAEPNCTYTIKVQTGTRENAGTDATVSLVLSDKSENGEYIQIKNLEGWGKMPPGHDYFENGDLDFFSGNERCLPSPVCYLTLKSDGTGNKPGWYVEYVDVTTTTLGSASKHQHFTVAQWLAIDEPPYELSTERNNCQESAGSEIQKSVYSIV